MNQPHTIRLSSWARLVGLALLLGVGVLASLGLATRPAHAQAASTVTITDCTNDGQLHSAINSASGGDTIIFGCSGTIRLNGTLSISKNLTLDGSGQSVTLDGGGSVQVLTVGRGINFTLNSLTIAHGNGTGGIGIVGGTVNISNSTFANNSASGGIGGGIDNDGGTVNISNSTFANNSASGGDGGGIGNDGTLTISNSTFSGNSASSGGGIENHSGTLSIGGSIVANNSGGNCGGTATIIDQGYNLENGTDCGFTGTGSLQNTDPRLASALASNGGPTRTLALLDGSPAINKIPSGSSCPSTDQRGISRPQGPACDIGAFEFRVPTLSLPATITVNATGPNGAPVTYTVTASEPDDAAATPTVSCSPASGSTFPVGTTTVNCSASDAASPPDTTTGSFQVVVVDKDLSLTNLPANITTDATSPQGATVSYTLPTVVDEESPLPAVSCTPTSGSTFAIGTTTVTCTVNDSDDTPSSVSQIFTVTVNGAATQVSALITTVNGMGLSSGLQNSLDVKLNAALKAVKAGQTAMACSDLSDFIGEAQSQSGKGLTGSQANQLIKAAKQVQAVLGC